MTSDPQELGKGLFGYRKSAVNQLLSDRDIMLRQAEGRVRAAESKVAELETELAGVRDRNNRMDEQLERLRNRLDALAGDPGEEAEHLRPADEAADESSAEADTHVDTPPADWPESPPLPEEPIEAGHGDFAGGFAATEAAFEGLDDSLSEDPPSEYAEPEHDHGISLFDESDAERASAEAVGIRYETPAEESAQRPAWLSDEPDPAQEEPPMGEMAFTTDYPFEPFEEETSMPDEAEPFALSYDPDRFGEGLGDLDASPVFDPSEDEPSSVGHWDVPSADPSESEPIADRAPADAEAAPEPDPYQPARYQPQAYQSEPYQPEPAPAPAEPEVSPAAIDVTNRFLTDEIQGILGAAEESASRIVERARSTTQNQIAQSNKLWREVQAELSRFAAWREQVDPVIASVQSKVEGVRAEIEAVPERIRQALSPMADSISTIDTDLAELAEACTPPLLLAPTGLDADADQFADWSDEAGPVEHGEGEAEGDEHHDGESSGHLAG